MRNMVILSRVGILLIAAWTVTSGAQAQTQTPGSGREGYAPGGLEYRIVHIRRHAGRFTHTFFASENETVPYLFIGEPRAGTTAPHLLVGGGVVGGAEHMTAGHHLAGRAGHPVSHIPLQGERGETLAPQVEAVGGDESDQGAAATDQPDPTANPSSQRPPGAAGPGRPVAGWSGPGLPGPGRPASPGW